MSEWRVIRTKVFPTSYDRYYWPVKSTNAQALERVDGQYLAVNGADDGGGVADRQAGGKGTDATDFGVWCGSNRHRLTGIPAQGPAAEGPHRSEDSGTGIDEQYRKCLR